MLFQRGGYLKYSESIPNTTFFLVVLLEKYFDANFANVQKKS